ncbi:MAG: SRPBCC family protein [Aeromicrobium sp.]|uniref:SRPBCC family protein n=1 Tax=Aeromicrobium sp. TaxID=1871063 RepID=UPI0026343D8B|nr:SRPBCC family protein [Aeromicrobium sp.]MDF1705140.1 SRPBCC family protein [Aeromicrobium sp.]
MEGIEIVREVPLPPEVAWARITDWPRHARAVPLTAIHRTPDGFVARTGLGRLGFDDPMRVVENDPPRYCRLVKEGRVVTGHAEIVVEPTTWGSRVTWRETLHVRGVPRAFSGLERWSSRLLFSRVLDDVLA